jgi:hypothetical protein
MKFKRNLLILSAILIGILIVVVGCLPAPTTPPVEEGDVPTNGTISVAAGATTTNDTTPTLTLSSTGATYMAFSGNGTTWSAWVAYATTYSTFNITTGEGCTSGDGTKIVYVKFKNDVGESTKVYDSILLDTAAPTLSAAVYTDVDSSGTVNSGDRVVFTFNDEMLTSTVTNTNVATSLLLSAGSYGTGPAVSWNAAGTVCTVTLGTSPTIVSGTTVNPSASVKDTAGNADASTAITISGVTATTVLSSVSISPSTYSATAGSSTTKTFTASALSTAATTMTSSCTFTWSISGAGGTISTTSGITTVYTPASSAGTDTIALSAVKTGTTTPIKTAYAYINVVTTTPPTPTVDPAKLFVSKQTGKATYTALPAGATSVTVYSHANQDPLAAVTAGVKYTIILSNIPTTATAPIIAKDYIYFMISYSDGTTSPVTYDGQLPDAPSAAALAKIQATNKNTVTSTATDNVVATDNITLYISSAQKSNPTPVGSPMTFVYDLAAADVPTYTRTNANGHESAVSGADGAIVQITGAAYAGGAANGIVEAGETITITYSGNVTVTVASLSFVLGSTTITADLAQGAVNTAVLTITGGPYDLSAQASVNFNLADENIVDASVGGGNWALEHASGIVWTPTVDF